ncbi:calaxin isoform X2 [Nelusetta ayraudi]|uniref:calaxin isoform X2 n=1 Tax=Nelusetta ayraudi TaxID=303726 RepID=UPI003F721502
MSELSAMSRKLIQARAESISKHVEHFSKAEVCCLIREFNALVGESSLAKKATSGLDRGKFRSILHNNFGMTDDMIMDGDCFHVYDLNGDNYISREEMFHMLKDSLIRQPSEEDPDEGIKDLVEIILKKMDHDHDGRLSFTDFEKSVKEENLLLEAFGTCLPDDARIETFERHVFKKQGEK